MPLFLFVFLLSRYHISVVNIYCCNQAYVYLRHCSSIWTCSKGIYSFGLDCLSRVWQSVVPKAFKKKQWPNTTKSPLFNCKINQNTSIALYSWLLTLKQLLKLATNANSYTTLVTMDVSEDPGPNSNCRNKPLSHCPWCWECSSVNLDASESFKAGRISKEIKELYSTRGLLLVLNLLCLFLCSNS